MGNEFVGLFEGAFVEQKLDALAGRHLALLVLARPALFASACLGQRVAALQFRQFLFQIHGRDYKQRCGMGAQTIAIAGSLNCVTEVLAGGSRRLLDGC